MIVYCCIEGGDQDGTGRFGGRREVIDHRDIFIYIFLKFFMFFNTQCLGSCQVTEGRTRRCFLNVSKGF